MSYPFSYLSIVFIILINVLCIIPVPRSSSAFKSEVSIGLDSNGVDVVTRSSGHLNPSFDNGLYMHTHDLLSICFYIWQRVYAVTV